MDAESTVIDEQPESDSNVVLMEIDDVDDDPGDHDDSRAYDHELELEMVHIEQHMAVSISSDFQQM